ncbi:hypothetical protein CYMTET_3248 [Cymbomonas tetramitiformis]|uniref:Uncharacterized protein n=1 Tax=Cymbomonas tetramitiformis TaxID=36881 RepID=A0AAE0BQQ6_9CHLO|nr:hypothetical protein CYMTET_49856 [Cymbomonas tetramitiformis]KAK3253631.1 hypothetical protein CYMTET_37129 [Cymbomonas tetramitiformis]KAK3289314.1 hypothetical protein CYMTET_3248 [Cymbomonas tetramitiformis]
MLSSTCPRSFYASELIDKAVKVPAGSFNAEWTKVSVRRAQNIPEFFTGHVTEYFKGSGAASTDRWKIVYEDGDETLSDIELQSSEASIKLPHVTLQFLKSYLVEPFPVVPVIPRSRNPTTASHATVTAGAANTLRTVDELDGDIDSSEDELKEGEYDEGDTPELASDSEESEEEHEIPAFSGSKFRFKWTKEADEVVEDQRAKDGGSCDTWSPKLRWDASELDKPIMATSYLKYFLLFFPVLLLPAWVSMLQSSGNARYGDAFLSGKRSLSVGLFLVWLGIWIFMLLNPGLHPATRVLEYRT